MKIILVTETFPPEVNGVAMTLQRLVEGLSKRGHELLVIRPRQNEETAQPDQCWRETTVRGLPIPNYPGLRFGLPNRNKMIRLLKKEKPDIIHVATEGPLGLMAVQLARKLGIPLSSSFHTNFHSYSKHYRFGFLLRPMLSYLRWIHNRTQVTFAPSQDLIKELQADNFKNLDILGRGVDTHLFQPSRRDHELRKEWGADENTPVLIYVGRIAAEKNVPLAIKAVRAMQEKLPNLKFVLVGDGPARKKIEQNHPDFIFAGMRRGEDLARHYASADFFPFASTTETFGNVVTEGMASGLCVQAFDYAAPGRYIQDGQNGYLIPFGEEQKFIEKAINAAENHEQWKSIAAAAVETVQPLSWDSILDHFEKRLCALAGAREVEKEPVLSEAH